jgi:hypothetical protein
MKIISLIIFFSLQCFSQDLENLAKQDTIYIALKDIDKNFSKQYKDFKYRSTVFQSFSEYRIIEPDGKQIIINTTKSYSVLNLKRKKFLKENSPNIIKLEYVEKIGVAKLFPQTLNVNSLRKIFFVFDERDLKKKYIKLKQVDVVAAVYDKI